MVWLLDGNPPDPVSGAPLTEPSSRANESLTARDFAAVAVIVLHSFR
jgi:hypothetical protein